MTYSFQAEHIADLKSLLAAIKKIEGVHWAEGNRDAIFSSFHVILVGCSEEIASKVQDLVFEYNDGAYCRFEEYTFYEEEEEEDDYV
jgi:hypothetical protein